MIHHIAIASPLSQPRDTSMHPNYLEYLRTCESLHRAAVITPDIVWYTLLCEVAELITGDRKRFRELFPLALDGRQLRFATSCSPGYSGEFIKALARRLPYLTMVFFPAFSTSTRGTLRTMCCAFGSKISLPCNAAPPCTFPAIDVRGNPPDWGKLPGCWEGVVPLLQEADPIWTGRVQEILQSCADRRCETSWWQAIDDWFPRLFREHATSHVFEVASSCHGLLSGIEEGIFLVPELGEAPARL